MTKPRTLLKILLVLSYIGSGLGLLGSLFVVAFRPLYEQMLALDPEQMPQMVKVSKIAIERALALPQAFYLASMALYALSLTGVTLMWKLRYAGFHCYTIAQLLLLLVPLVFFGKGALSLGEVMFTALFVFYYWRLMKYFENLPDEEPATPGREE